MTTPPMIEETFDAWAPMTAPWSQWAKPSLFTQLRSVKTTGAEEAEAAALDVTWAPRDRERTALVIDLPGAQSAIAGLRVASEGYRPVPLYNTSIGANSIVNVDDLARFLVAGARVLRDARIPADAPPAFLLDSKRLDPGAAPAPGKFDNRWVTFPQDFPSGTHLLSRGITSVLLMSDAAEPRDDLAHVLLRWQQAGVRIEAMTPLDRRPRELHVRPPSRFRRAWYRVVAMSGLRRNDVGGFGAMIPLITTSSGGFG